MRTTHSYVFVELGLLATAAALTWRAEVWRELLQPVNARRVVSVTALWWTVDVVAVRIGLWSFPAGGTLPFRVAGLPVEEFLGLLTHTLVTFVLVRFFQRA